MNKPGNNNILWRYAGLATQFLIGIAIFLYLGLKIDGWLKIKTPVAVWVLPLLFIVAVIIKIVKDTAQKK